MCAMVKSFGNVYYRTVGEKVRQLYKLLFDFLVTRNKSVLIRNDLDTVMRFFDSATIFSSKCFSG